MKRFYISSMLIALTFFSQAQNPNQTGVRQGSATDRNRQQTQTNTGLPGLSVRAQIMNEQMTQEMGNARWMRVMIRELDLEKEKNAPLYYPVQEVNGMKNFFATVFQLYNEGKITVYKHLGDYESFEDDNKLHFRDMLTDFNIFYREIPAAGGGSSFRYVINPSDLPAVRSIYVKEAWYFDQNNSICDVKTLAVCPIGYFILDIGETRQPLFWVKYEDIRPYIKENYIMTSNLNNAKNYSMDDFFRLRMFDGIIIQTENLMNLPLVRLFDTDEEVMEEQQRIESQLQEFRETLWIKPDTTSVVLTRREARRVTSARSTPAPKAAPKEKAPKQPKAKPERTPSASTTRSIRR